MGHALEIVQVVVTTVVKAHATNLVKVIVVWSVGLVVSLVAQVAAVCHAKEHVIFHHLDNKHMTRIKENLSSWQSGMAKNITFIVTKDSQSINNEKRI